MKQTAVTNILKQVLVSVAYLSCLALMPTAHADADCPVYPKAEWASEDSLRKAMADEGIKIKKFKISGNCYEIYGRNAEGKKVEIYFDAKTLAVIKAEVEN